MSARSPTLRRSSFNFELLALNQVTLSLHKNLKTNYTVTRITSSLSMPEYYDTYQSTAPARSRYQGGSNLLEIVLPILSLIVLVGVSIWGFWSQHVNARSLQKQADMQNILAALEDFYQNSDPIPGKRNYPKAKCQGKLNSVDYEYTLRRILTGQQPSIDTHTFISSQDFPQDPWGKHTTQLGGHSRNTLPNCSVTQKFPSDRQLVYPDLKTSSCLYNPRREGYRQCYLYTTSVIGDSFQLAYYDSSQSRFVIYTKFRNQPLEQTVEKIG
jgi:Tfp pilus assembly protein PilE